MSDRVVHCPFPDDTPVPEHSFAETIWKTMKKFREKLAVVRVSCDFVSSVIIIIIIIIRV